MLEAAKTEEILSAVEETARLLDVTCSRDRIRPALTAYGDVLANSHIVFSMATGKHHEGDFQFDFSVPREVGDPHAVAVSHGLVDEVDHPITTLFSDLRARCPIETYGVDYGVVGGFKKSYAGFPLDAPQELSSLADIPSMPRGLAEHARSFADYGLDGRVSAIAIDYANRTWNVYFSGLPAECVEPKAVLPMLRELGLPEPSEQMLEFIRTSFAMYPTFGWDSSKVERICFSARSSDPTELPARIEPRIGKFAGSAPYAYTGERVLVYAGAVSSDEEYYKLASYYQKASDAPVRMRRAA